ncbi:hypothetical protein AB7W88_04880 [Providencia vermicola]|nr:MULTISPECIES: hypothetical protein [Providencia]WBA58688.1 hypothetical protein O7C57_09065 [Providencia sp. 21OH12SH02B-Prov]WER23848.1 hypothetical protein P2E04_08350 [Providencia stuartii]WER27968.1 hypothetical protein P2E05_08355 [Providencia stuartii]WER32059.1 hypothetical protein P2E06_08355 [Providencia stuartii]
MKIIKKLLNSQYVGYCLTVFMMVIFGVPPSECEKEMQNDK